MARVKAKARKNTGGGRLIGKPLVPLAARGGVNRVGGQAAKFPKKNIRTVTKTVAKKRPAKRGSVALKEIRKYQHSTENLIPFRPFSRVVREITQHVEVAGANMRWTKMGILAVQEAAEMHAIQVLEDANLIAIHAKRVTIMPRDIKLAIRLMGLM
eukprot:TRINITY_DN1416_c1_g1_i3.p2 TRINITY_DN1416_c1_g1~~TRINITY_DN1416_c1_g1_i3.p2  ORF type:complete len:156 (-),score=16.46 TRINITY_DN1416_c1_g1_i3:1010-1477(-)